MRFSPPSLVRLIALTGSVFILGGCQHVDVKQLTYGVLRADDCKRNELEDVCTRNFASEYRDYVNLRQQFLTTQLPQDRIEQRDTLTLGEQLLVVN